jgi:hypothetical protein
MRLASTLGVAACFAVFAWRVSEADREADLGWGLITRGPVLFAVLAAVVLCTVTVALRLVRRVPPARLRWRAFAPAVAVALLAATPISFVYDDGCNDHSTISPVATTPLIALTHPQHTVTSYSDVSTLVACSNRQSAGRPLAVRSLGRPTAMSLRLAIGRQVVAEQTAEGR